MGECESFERGNVAPYGEIALSAMLANAYPLMFREGWLFFRRGGYGGRTVVIRNH